MRKKHSYSEVMAGLPLAMSIPRILVYHSMNVIYYFTIHAIVTRTQRYTKFLCFGYENKSL